MDNKIKNKLTHFFSQYNLQTFKKGEALLRPDEDPGFIFLIKNGVVRRYSISGKGEELTLNIYKNFSFFPVSNALDNSINSHYYEAMGRVEVYRAPKEAVLDFLKKEPEVVLDLLARIYRGLDGLWLRIEYLMSGNINTKLLVELLILARRFGVQKNRSVLIAQKFTQKDIATLAGITRESISRGISKLRKTGLIEFKKGLLEITDINKLEKELSHHSQ